MTFPVLTYSLIYKDGKFQDEEFASGVQITTPFGMIPIFRTTIRLERCRVLQASV